MYLTMARILRVGPIIIRPNKYMIQYADTSMPSKEFILRLQLIWVMPIKNLGLDAIDITMEVVTSLESDNTDILRKDS